MLRTLQDDDSLNAALRRQKASESSRTSELKTISQEHPQFSEVMEVHRVVWGIGPLDGVVQAELDGCRGEMAKKKRSGGEEVRGEVLKGGASCQLVLL